MRERTVTGARASSGGSEAAQRAGSSGGSARSSRSASSPAAAGAGAGAAPAAGAPAAAGVVAPQNIPATSGAAAEQAERDANNVTRPGFVRRELKTGGSYAGLSYPAGDNVEIPEAYAQHLDTVGINPDASTEVQRESRFGGGSEDDQDAQGEEIKSQREGTVQARRAHRDRPEFEPIAAATKPAATKSGARKSGGRKSGAKSGARKSSARKSGRKSGGSK